MYNIALHIGDGPEAIGAISQRVISAIDDKSAIRLQVYGWMLDVHAVEHTDLTHTHTHAYTLLHSVVQSVPHVYNTTSASRLHYASLVKQNC
jgi:hypothetical protein